MEIPEYKPLRRAYGFDEVALVPGEQTINPDQVDTTFRIGDYSFAIPILAAAMDAVVDPAFAIAFGQMGGLAVLNLEGLQTRYEDPEPLLTRIAEASSAEVTSRLQHLYSEPIKDHLIAERIAAITRAGVICAVSVTPANTKRLGPLAVAAGAKILVVQSTVTTAKHVSKSYHGLHFEELRQQIEVPILVGNCASYRAALELMETGIDGILVGVGPGAACTTREVIGVGVPQVTAIMDSASAREEYYRRTERYVAVIADGGMRTGGDICKAIASGADAVMIGSSFAQTREAPGKGAHWGMATPHPSLPRGTRIKVGVDTTLQELLFGPTSRTDGTHNLVGALQVGMGVCGAATIRDMHKAEMVIAPAIKTEGKIFQLSQSF